MHATLMTIGRIILGLFLIAHAFVFAKGGYDAGSLAGLAGYVGSRNLPQPLAIAYAVIALEAICGLALMFNFLTTPIALGFAAFCLVTAVVFHNVWAMPADKVYVETQYFLKDIGLVGAFLLLAANGFDARASG